MQYYYYYYYFQQNNIKEIKQIVVKNFTRNSEGKKKKKNSHIVLVEEYSNKVNQYSPLLYCCSGSYIVISQMYENRNRYQIRMNKTLRPFIRLNRTRAQLRAAFVMQPRHCHQHPVYIYPKHSNPSQSKKSTLQPFKFYNTLYKYIYVYLRTCTNFIHSTCTIPYFLINKVLYLLRLYRYSFID